MKMNRFDIAVGSVLGVLGVALGVLILSGNWIGARVLRTFPDDASMVNPLGRIGLEFAQPMQAQSVEAALQIEPSVTGTITWDGRTVWFVPAVPFRPDVAYSARLRAGAMSQGGLTVKRDVVWHFSAPHPWVVYLSAPLGSSELWRIPSTGGAPEQITHTNGQVYDYAASFRTRQIVYSVINAQMGSDLWLADGNGTNARLLVNCGGDRCSVPVWSPDGLRVAFSREGAGLAPGAPLSPPRVWTVDVATGQSAALYQDSQVLGYGPSWSPDGSRLAVYDGGAGGLRILNLQTSDEMLLTTLQGEMGTWSPDGQKMIYTDLKMTPAVPYLSLYQADFAQKTTNPIVGGEDNGAQYGQPAWSPNGEWLAVPMVVVGGPGRGRQIWLMRPDGSDAHAITSDAQFGYGGCQWDPWGQALLFQRFEIDKPYPVPEILVWTQTTGKAQVLIQDVYGATWLP